MKILRRLALGAAALVVIALAVFLALVVSGFNTAHSTASNPVPALRVPPDPSLLPRGEHLATVLCVSCHSPNVKLPLSGSDEDFFAEIKGPSLGHLDAPNLTPGGRLALYSDGELSRAIREGVNRERLPMLVMPSRSLHDMSDRDLAAVITYLRSQPAVVHTVAKRQLTWMSCLILGAHAFETSHTLPVSRPAADVPEGMASAYGEYMTKLLACRDCHGPDLKGGRPGQYPPIGPNLLAVVSTHELAAFDGALRHGLSARDGHPLDPAKMPYLTLANLNDSEVGAIYTYLQTLAKH